MHFCNFPHFNQSTPESSLDRPLLSGLFSQSSQNWCKVAGLSKLSTVVSFVDYKISQSSAHTPHEIFLWFEKHYQRFSLRRRGGGSRTIHKKVKSHGNHHLRLDDDDACIKIIVLNCLSFELQPVVGPGWVQWQSFLKINITIYTFINLYLWPFEKHLESIIPFLPFLLPAIFLFSYFIWSSTAMEGYL